MSEDGLRIIELDHSWREPLARILIDTVAANGSVGFMHPLSIDDALSFWDGAFAAAGRGERLILGALDGDRLLGSVTLVPVSAPSQPHRAELSKFIVAPEARGRGIGTALLQAVEVEALARERDLLVLDTSVVEGASSLYRRHGYREVGVIPDFAMKPRGELADTRLFCKRLGGDGPVDAGADASSLAPDEAFMRQALALAQRAQEEDDEIPVGAVVVSAQGEVIGEGWNRNIAEHDASSHAEIVAMRRAGQTIGNHRLVGCTLYVTLEPCAMCAMAMVHARLARAVFGAFDPKTGAAGSVFNLIDDPRHNHRINVRGGVLADEAGLRLANYFRAKRGLPPR